MQFDTAGRKKQYVSEKMKQKREMKMSMIYEKTGEDCKIKVRGWS